MTTRFHGVEKLQKSLRRSQPVDYASIGSSVLVIWIVRRPGVSRVKQGSKP